MCAAHAQACGARRADAARASHRACELDAGEQQRRVGCRGERPHVHFILFCCFRCLAASAPHVFLFRLLFRFSYSFSLAAVSQRQHERATGRQQSSGDPLCFRPRAAAAAAAGAAIVRVRAMPSQCFFSRNSRFCLCLIFLFRPASCASHRAPLLFLSLPRRRMDPHKRCRRVP